MAEPTVTIPLSEYKQLVESAMNDDYLSTCESCGAWLTIDELASVISDVKSCWYYCTRREKDRHTCKRHRADMVSDAERLAAVTEPEVLDPAKEAKP